MEAPGILLILVTSCCDPTTPTDEVMAEVSHENVDRTRMIGSRLLLSGSDGGESRDQVVATMLSRPAAMERSLRTERRWRGVNLAQSVRLKPGW